jgi:hypothetical protein
MWTETANGWQIHRGKLTIWVYWLEGTYVVWCKDLNVHESLRIVNDLRTAKDKAIKLVHDRLTELSANAKWMVQNG